MPAKYPPGPLVKCFCRPGRDDCQGDGGIFPAHHLRTRVAQRVWLTPISPDRNSAASMIAGQVYVAGPRRHVGRQPWSELDECRGSDLEGFRKQMLRLGRGGGLSAPAAPRPDYFCWLAITV